jgi:hypothetical protein
VRRGRGVVERRNPEPAVRVDARRIGDDLGEAAEHAVVRQDGLDEEGVGVAHHLQVTPANGRSSMPLPESKIGRSVGNRHGVVVRTPAPPPS